VQLRKPVCRVVGRRAAFLSAINRV
jgi:hypothetical protein